MLISSKGTILTKESEVDPIALSPSDDWRVLSDGTVAWTYIDSAGTLSLYTLPTPPATSPAIDPFSYVDSLGNSESAESVVIPTDENNKGTGSISLRSFSALLLGLLLAFLAL